MNLALLAKQDWRIAIQEASLLSKLLKGMYFRRTSFFNTEPWIPREIDFKCRGGSVGECTVVSDLITNGEWDNRKLEEIMGQEDVARILSIPLSRRHLNDKLIWHHTESGGYLTWLGYKCARALKRNVPSRRNWSRQTGDSKFPGVPDLLSPDLWRWLSDPLVGSVEDPRAVEDLVGGEEFAGIAGVAEEVAGEFCSEVRVNIDAALQYYSLATMFRYSTIQL
ncbi:hypothetical protein LIER_13977 [Lithospermum erythrorhizon]|uniref:Uncharacterized protein n=1 Tax=Lithospermum erythrorhizon TaxID=34254 RepID=A0AAV3PXD0_LITER